MKFINDCIENNINNWFFLKGIIEIDNIIKNKNFLIFYKKNYNLNN